MATRHPATGRIPASRYFGGGSSFPKYRKPTNFKALPKVANVRKQGTRTWLVEFEDGMGVFVNEADNPGRFYTLRVHDRVRWYEEQRPEPPPDEARRYQYAALTSVIPHQSAFHIDPYGHLMADVDELYPRGDATRRSRDDAKTRADAYVREVMEAYDRGGRPAAQEKFAEIVRRGNVPTAHQMVFRRRVQEAIEQRSRGDVSRSRRRRSA